MFFIVHQLEIYPATGNIDIKLYNLFPVTSSCIPGSILIDTATLLKIFRPADYTLLCRGEGAMSDNAIKSELWSNYFITSKFKPFAQYKFGCSISTDGVSVGIIFVRTDIEDE